MKKARKRKQTQDMLAEYDFPGAVRGKYYSRVTKGTNLVLLAPDVAKYFPDEDSLNDLLRAIIRVGTRRRRSA